MSVNKLNGITINNLSTILGVVGCSSVFGQTVVTGETEIATDTFTYGNGTSLAGLAKWDASVGDFIADTNQAVPNNSSADSVIYETSTYNANQYSRATLSGISGNTVGGVAVRAQVGTANFYYFWYNSFAGAIELGRSNSGTRTVIVSLARTPSAGYKLDLQATGTGSATRLTAREDTGSGWSAVWSAQDPGGTYIDGGKPGLSGYGASGSPLMDNWSGGNL